MARRNEVLYIMYKILVYETQRGLPEFILLSLPALIFHTHAILFPFPGFHYVCSFLWAKYFATHFVRLSLDKKPPSLLLVLFFLTWPVGNYFWLSQTKKAKARLTAVLFYITITLFHFCKCAIKWLPSVSVLAVHRKEAKCV